MTSEGITPKVNGDTLFASDFNRSYQLVSGMIAGEAITEENCVYINDSNGKVYVSDYNTHNDYRCKAIARTTAVSGAAVTVQKGGVVDSLSGLTINKVYYLSGAGSMTTVPTAIKLGVALSNNELWLDIVEDNGCPIRSTMGIASNLAPHLSITAYWQLCDGTVLDDTESPLNGETIPDLNGDSRLIMANDTAGGTTTEDFLPDHFHSLRTDEGAPAAAEGGPWVGNSATAIETKTAGTAMVAHHLTYVMCVKQ